MDKLVEVTGASLGEQNGRLMGAYACYSVADNPHKKGTKAHDAFIIAFNKERARCKTN